MTDGEPPYPITTHMLFHMGVSAGWQPPPERWRRVLNLHAGVTLFGLGTWGTLVLGRVRVLGLEDCLLVEHPGVQEGLLHWGPGIHWTGLDKS